MPDNVAPALENGLKLSIGRMRRLISLRSCSMLLFKDWLCWMRIESSLRREQSVSQLVATARPMASRLVWPPSMTMRFGRP